MKNKTPDAKKQDRRFEFEGGKIERRETKILQGKTYLFEDELRVKGSLEAKVIMCAGWLLELFELESGEIFFTCGAREIRPATNRFGIFYAPFSITEPHFSDTKANVNGIAGREFLSAKFMRAPFVFETNFAGKPETAADVEEILKSGSNFQSIETNPHASLISLKAKRLIDENYHVYPSIARVAARIGVSHEHLSRQFKLDFGMTPSQYLREIRVSDATFRLAQGEEIINVSHDVGYNDLSRFYKQFRKSAKTSPGICRTMVKQIAPEK